MKNAEMHTLFDRVVLALSLILAWGACGATMARADLVFGIADAIGNPGSSTNGFDVTLTNTGSSDVAIAGFSFEVTTTSSDVSFSDVNVSTQSAPYIFVGNSLFGPDITNSAVGDTSISAADNVNTPSSSATLASGATLDLGHVVFALNSNASSIPIPISFSNDANTGVNDPSGTSFSNLSIPAPGAITIPVGGVVVPEPASVVLGLQTLLLAGSIAYGAQAQGQPTAQ